jgi:hypothetical protein
VFTNTCFLTFGIIPASVPMQLSSVKTLNGTNYDDWKESLDIYLAITQMDLALRVDAPAALTDASTEAEKAYYEKWQNSNRVCLMVIKYSMDKTIRQGILEQETAAGFLKAIGEKFKKFDKAQKGHYLSLLENTAFDGVGSVREHMMKLVNYFNKLKNLGLDLGESFLVWRILESLPSQYQVLKTSYNTQ